MSSNCCGCVDEKERKLQEIIEKYKNIEGALIPVLHEAQDVYGYLPMSVQKKISEEMNIPLSEIYGVVTFYTQFTLKPKGKYKVNVCMGTACYVKGAKAVYERLQKELNVKPGDTTEDKKFTLMGTRCLGCCGLAPVLTVDEDVYGRLTPDDIPDILSKY